MRWLVPAIALGLLTAAFACSDDTSSGTLPATIAVTIRGRGRVTSEPAGIDCTSDGSQALFTCPLGTFTAESPVILRATATDASTRFDKWTVDGSFALVQTDGSLQAKVHANQTQNVEADFQSLTGGAPPSGPPTPGGNVDGGNEGGVTDRTCGTATCTGTDKCCVGKTTGEFACKADCGTDVVAPCGKSDACGTGNVCCIELGDELTDVACRVPSTCTGQTHFALCEATCTNGFACNTLLGSVKGCQPAGG